MNTKPITLCSLMALIVCFISCQSTSTQPNTLVVVGTGMVHAKPDQAQLSLEIAYTAPTTQEAKTVVEHSVQQLIALLRAQQIKDEAPSTTSLSYTVEYEYAQGKRYHKGQRVTQSFRVTLDSIHSFSQRLSTILDQLVQIPHLEVHHLAFDIHDKEALYAQSRELAYQKAQEKATQYAQLSGRTLGSVLHITEEGTMLQPMQQNMYRTTVAYKEVATEYATDGASIPTGEQAVSTSLQVVFALK